MADASASSRRRAADWLAYAGYDVIGDVLGLTSLPLLPFLLPTRHGRGLGERLGRIPSAARALQRPLWVHAASVGEVLAAAALIDALRARWPAQQILLSTTSVSGRETARARVAADAVMLLPFDLGVLVGSVMRRLRPRGLIIVETEIWPALIRAAARQQVPCVVVSGRVSARAAARYGWIRWLMRAVLPRIDFFAMQTAADAARVVALGAAPTRVEVVGSLKLARAGTAVAGGGVLEAAAQALMGGRPVLAAASTHDGEEQLVVEACGPLWKAHPDLLLLLAPRRPQRFDEVDRWLSQVGVAHQRRSRVERAVTPATRVLLLDTVGELPNLLPAARAVFVGGTIVPVGGHNVLEPALFGKPVAFGPHTENVAAAAEELIAAAAGTRVRDAGELGAEWGRLLRAPRQGEEMGARGRAVLAARAGVAERSAEVVGRCMHLDSASHVAWSSQSATAESVAAVAFNGSAPELEREHKL